MTADRTTVGTRGARARRRSAAGLAPARSGPPGGFFLTGLGLLSLLTIAVASTPARSADLGGRSFGDPDVVMPMPDGWAAQPIRRPPDSGADIALALDQQLYPAVVPLVQRWAAENGVKVALEEGTCGLAAGALADRTADITGMCCPPGDLDRLPGVRYHTLGIAALALLVHPSNRVDDVTLDEARRLFGGETRSWADMPVSGVKTVADSQVRAVGRLHCKVRPGHWRLLLDTENDFSESLFEVPAIVDMIGEVARNPTAVGYETLWHVADHQSRVGRVKVLHLGGVDPFDNDAIAAGGYPLYRVFNITSWTDLPAANEHADRLVAWLVAHADDIDPAYGFVSASRLRAAGWGFAGNELVAEPGR